MAKKKRARSATQAEQPNAGEHPKAEKPEKGSKRHRTTVAHEELVGRSRGEQNLQHAALAL